MAQEPNHIDNLELEEGDELHFEGGCEWQIVGFEHDEDMVDVRRLSDGISDSWPGKSIQAALIHGECKTPDGEGQELVKHF
jgi:hypothetical protein